MVSPGPFGSFVRTVMVGPMEGIDDLGDVPALQGRWETVARALLVVVVGASGRSPLIWRFPDGSGAGRSVAVVRRVGGQPLCREFVGRCLARGVAGDRGEELLPA